MEPLSQPRISGGKLHLLPVVFYGGVLLGAAECMYHHLGSGPAGALRANGMSWIVFMSLQAMLLTVSGVFGVVLVRLLRWASGRRGPASPGDMKKSRKESVEAGLIWFFAILPTVWVDLDHLVRFSHWPWMQYHHPEIFAGQVFSLTLVLSLVLAAASTKPSRWYLDLVSRNGWAQRMERALIAVAVFLVAAGAWQLRPSPVGRARASSTMGEESPALSLGGSGGRLSSNAPNILLFTVDTLRQDALGAYGGTPTPGFDTWISQGVRIDGWTCSPWTRPTFASLFSAVAPTGHGADKDRRVFPEVNWWPEVLQKKGYLTRAWVCNPHLEASLGFARGFSRFDHSSQIEILDPAAQMLWVRWLHRHLQERLDRGDRIIHRAQRWLGKSSDGPWMVWVHVLDPHMPYHLRGPHGEVDDPDPGPWIDPLRPYLDHGTVRDVRMIREVAPELSPGAKAALAEFYRREVLFLDRQVLGLLESAQRASGERPLLWVLAADHGEEFFDHGGFEHGHTLYSELLRVPLAFGGLDLPRNARAGSMKIEDVGPTVLSLLGFSPMELQGRAIGEIDSTLAPFVLGEDRSELLYRVLSPAAARAEEGEEASVEEGALASVETRAEANVEESAKEGSPVGDSLPCRPPCILAEDLLYGPQRTRFLFPDGKSVQRNDEQLSFAEVDACPRAAERLLPMDPAKLTERERALFRALDHWRAAAAKIPHAKIDDPALRARLRSLGYVQ